MTAKGTSSDQRQQYNVHRWQNAECYLKANVFLVGALHNSLARFLARMPEIYFAAFVFDEDLAHNCEGAIENDWGSKHLELAFPP